MTKESVIQRILTAYWRIAVVGLSDKPERPSNQVARYLIKQGFEVIPVNPFKEEILGLKSYPDLGSVPQAIDIVNEFRRVEHVPPVVDEAVAIGAKVVWMQLGIMHDESARTARDAGLEVVMDRCIKIEHSRLMRLT